MKKLFKGLFKILLIGIILMCLVNALGILDFSDFMQISKEENKKYSNYYFNNLDEEEKRIYIKMAKTIEENKTEFKFLNIKDGDIDKKIDKVFNAYVNDNPEIFYLSNRYVTLTKTVLVFEYNSVIIQYDSTVDIEKGKEKINTAADDFLKGLIYSNMSDFEKEIAIHDKLVSKVKYYEYEKISEIPNIKHTAYGALVEHEAVCDGYSKAFKILLDKVGIENIIALGILQEESHAWNIVKIGNDYYHTDVTSDVLKENNKRYAIHAYFNLSDNEVLRTHEIDNNFELPVCNNDKYNYYIYTDNILKATDDISSRLKTIIRNNSNKEVLEFKDQGNSSSTKIIDTLYELDFDRWMTRGVTNIKYNKIDNMYVFKKF